MFPEGTNTLIGIVVALAPTVLSWFGYAPTPAFDAEFSSAFMAILTLVGGLYAAWGRLRANVPGWFAKKEL